MSSLRAVLVGTGRIARQHLMCLASVPEAEVVGVCDLSPAAAEMAAERFGVARWDTDYDRLVGELRPDVVHVTTPPASHAALVRRALEAGAHVIVEKPLAARGEEVGPLIELAQSRGLALVEDYNYVFNPPVQRLIELVAAGATVLHVDVTLCLDILGPDGGFADPNLPNTGLDARGGAIGDFLPHLASLAHAFTGPQRSVSSLWTKRSPGGPLEHDEFRALVDGERATASLAFSAQAQPDMFILRLHTTHFQATAGLFEPRLTVDRVRGGSPPLARLFNGVAEGKAVSGAAITSLWGKVGAVPGSYEGLWSVLRETYAALAADEEPPIGLRRVREVNALVDDLLPRAAAA